MIIPTGYAQVNFMFSGIGAPEGAEVTFGLQIGAPGPTPEEVANAAGDAWGATIFQFQSDDVTFDGTYCKFGPNATGPDGYSAYGLAGVDSGTQSPPNTCFLLRKTTVDGGRAGRGRSYVPGVNENRVEPDGAVSSVVVTDLTTACGEFLTMLVAADLNGVVLHGAGSPLTTPSLITSMRCDPKVATQRRRLR